MTECLTGYTGTANIGADDLIEIVKGIIGAENRVLTTGSRLVITVNTGGVVTIGTGSFVFDGIIGRVKEAQTVSYTPPGSDNLYKKIWIAVKYTQADSVDTFELYSAESSEYDTAAAAEEATHNFSSTEITYGTTTLAYMPLWSFVCSASTVIGDKQQLFTFSDNIQSMQVTLQSMISSANAAECYVVQYSSAKAAFISAAQSQINSLESSVNTALTEYQSYADGLPANIQTLASLISVNGTTVTFAVGDNKSIAIGLYDNCPAIVFTNGSDIGRIYMSNGTLMQKINDNASTGI